MRKRYSPEFKAKVALEALRERKTLNALASEHGVHSMLIQKWKREAVASLTEGFSRRGRSRKEERDRERLVESLYCEIGRLKVERDWVKKKFGALDG